MYVYHIGLRIEMIVPDIFKQHGAGHDVAGVADQVLEQFEFAWLQHDGLAVA